MRKWTTIILLALSATSCKVADTLADTAAELFRGEVVARAGDHMLRRSQLEKYIPQGVSSEDSINLARQYIDAWAEDILLLDMADKQLSKEEKDVSRELEDYRRTLLKYRYEQRYIEERLDTLITDEEVSRFYRENPEKFSLERPVVKVRYLIIPADAKSVKNLRRLLASEEESDIMDAAAIAAVSAIKFADQSDTWTDALTLAQNLGMEYQTLLGSLKSNNIEYTDAAGHLHLAHITEMIAEGKTAPEEFVRERIRDLILSIRKHNLEVSLERELLEDARRHNKYVIY